MRVDIITVFPNMFGGVFEYGIPQRALQKGLIEVNVVDLRRFTDDRHRTVDDRPYGGGEGMVLKPKPVFRAVEACRREGDASAFVALFSPQGSRFDQSKALQLSLRRHLILVCGRYEGVDQRVADYLADEEISLGDFVLSGGELAAMAVVDAVSRLIPGAVGNPDSVLEESFMNGLLDYPQYTRPAEFLGWRVPEVLLSGDHLKVRRWREREALRRTRQRRPDLLVSARGERAMSHLRAGGREERCENEPDR
ncbi:MAG: tRNA (guanosine(37)-N1)-methyltransferase TrmD [Acidobacteriota bacterium]